MKKGLALKTAANWMNGVIESDLHAFGASVDSRLVKKGDLFFACPGQKNDGHEFLSEASRNGAVAAVVSKGYSGSSFGLPLIFVEQPEKSLQILAKTYLNSLKTSVIAITGSTGKTTTKEFITHFIKTKYHVAATPGNYNSQLGLPLTILNHATEEEEFLVLEMGMTKAGHIASLVQIAPPDLAIITGVSYAHAENFSSIEAIGRAKAEIFSHPKTKIGVIDRSIINYDEIMATYKNCTLLSFSCSHFGAEYSLLENKEKLSLKRKDQTLALFDSLPFPGKHNKHNFLAAILAANHYGISWESIRHSAQSLTLPPMRLQIDIREGITCINDAYNALPEAVKGALDSLPNPSSNGRKIAVLSEMRELGAFSEKCHADIGEYALSRVDVLLCMGAECAPIYSIWKTAGKPILWLNDLSTLAKELKALVQAGDVILIKGSRASGFSTLPNLWTQDKIYDSSK